MKKFTTFTSIVKDFSSLHLRNYRTSRVVFMGLFLLLFPLLSYAQRVNLADMTRDEILYRYAPIIHGGVSSPKSNHFEGYDLIVAVDHDFNWGTYAAKGTARKYEGGRQGRGWVSANSDFWKRTYLSYSLDEINKHPNRNDVTPVVYSSMMVIGDFYLLKYHVYHTYNDVDFESKYDHANDMEVVEVLVNKQGDIRGVLTTVHGTSTWATPWASDGSMEDHDTYKNETYNMVINWGPSAKTHPRVWQSANRGSVNANRKDYGHAIFVQDDYMDKYGIDYRPVGWNKTGKVPLVGTKPTKKTWRTNDNFPWRSYGRSPCEYILAPLEELLIKGQADRSLAKEYLISAGKVTWSGMFWEKGYFSYLLPGSTSDKNDVRGRYDDSYGSDPFSGTTIYSPRNRKGISHPDFTPTKINGLGDKLTTDITNWYKNHYANIIGSGALHDTRGDLLKYQKYKSPITTPGFTLEATVTRVGKIHLDKAGASYNNPYSQKYVQGIGPAGGIMLRASDDPKADFIYVGYASEKQRPYLLHRKKGKTDMVELNPGASAGSMRSYRQFRLSVYENSVMVTVLDRTGKNHPYEHTLQGFGINSAAKGGPVCGFLTMSDVRHDANYYWTNAEYSNVRTYVDNRPAPPKSLRSERPSRSSIKLTWRAPDHGADIKGYNIYRDGIRIGTTTGLTYTDSHLTFNNKTHTYAVSSVSTVNRYSPKVEVKVTDVGSRKLAGPHRIKMSGTSIYWVPKSYNEKKDTPVDTYIFKQGKLPYNWHLKKNADGSYYIMSINKGDTLYLTTSNDTPVKALDLVIGAKGPGGTDEMHKWIFEPTGSGVDNEYRIKMKYNSYYITTQGLLRTSGGRLTTWDMHSGTKGKAEKWIVEDAVPAPPQNLKTSRITARSIVLTWQAPNNGAAVRGYDIYRDGTKTGTITGTKYTDSNLSPTTSHTYTVLALGMGDLYSSSSAKVEATTIAEGTRPIEGLHRIKMSGTSNYWVPKDHKKNNGTAIGIHSLEQGELAYNWYLEKNIDGSYYITIGAEGTSYLTTKSSTKAKGQDLVIDAKGSFGVADTRKWLLEPVGTTGGNEYRIKMKGTSHYITTRGLVSTSGAQLTMQDLNTDTNAQKWVLEATVPEATQNLTASTVTSNSIKLTWKEPENRSTWQIPDNGTVKGHAIYRDNVRIGTTTSLSSFTDSGLMPNKSYTYTVFSVSTQDVHSVKREIKVTTKGTRPIEGQHCIKMSGTSNYWVPNNYKQIYLETSVNTHTFEQGNTAYNWYLKNVLWFGEENTDTDASYYITLSTGGTSYYLSTKSSTPEKGEDLVIDSKGWTAENNQQWLLEPTGSGVDNEYRIRPVNYTSDYVTTQRFSQTSGGRLTTWDINPGTNAQKWIIERAVPAVPRNFKADETTARSIKLVWQAPGNGVPVKKYEIYRGGTKIGTTTSRVYTDNNLEINRSYTYFIKALSTGGLYSAPTQKVKVATTGTRPIEGLHRIRMSGTSNYWVPNYYKEANGTGIDSYTYSRGSKRNLYNWYLTRNTDGSYYITLKGNTSQSYSYLTTRNSSKGKGHDVVIDAKGSSTVADTRKWLLEPTANGVDNEYRIRLKGTSNYITTSNFSHEKATRLTTWDLNSGTNGDAQKWIIDPVIPNPPQDLKAYLVTHNSISLKWSPAKSGPKAKRYDIYKDRTWIATVKGKSYTDSDLIPNKTHKYFVLAIEQYDHSTKDSHAYSSPSNTVTATTLSTRKIEQLHRIRMSGTSHYWFPDGFKETNGTVIKAELYLSYAPKRNLYNWYLTRNTDGSYYITSKGNTSQSSSYLTTSNSSKGKGHDVVIDAKGSSTVADTRKWLLEPTGSGVDNEYRIKMKGTSNYITTQNFSHEKAKRLTTWDLNSGTNGEAQKWILEPVSLVTDGSEFSVTMNNHPDKYWHMAGNNTTYGDVEIYNNNAYGWVFEKIGKSGNLYNIRLKGTNNYLEIVGNTQKPGARVDIYPLADANDFKWHLEPTGIAGTYYVRSYGTNLYITTAGYSSSASAKLQLYGLDKTKDSFKWKLSVPKVTIPDKSEFKVTMNNHTDKYWHMAGNNTTDGDVEIYNNNAYNWVFEKIDKSGNLYNIRLTGTNNYLEIAGNTQKPGARVDIYSLADANDYKWHLEPTGIADTYYVRSYGTNLYITTAGYSSSASAKLQLYGLDKTKDSFKWKLSVPKVTIPDKSEFKVTMNNHTDKYWHMAAYNTTDGDVEIYYNNTYNWVFERYNGTNLYHIRLKGTNNYITVSSYKQTSGNQVQIYPLADNNSYKWYLEPTGIADTYYVRSYGTNLYITTAGYSSSASAELQLYGLDKTKDSFKWKLSSVPKVTIPDKSEFIVTMNNHSDKYWHMDAYNATDNDVEIFDSDVYSWVFERYNNTNLYHIRLQGTNDYITVSSYKQTSGNQVQIHPLADNNSYKWYLEPTGIADTYYVRSYGTNLYITTAGYSSSASAKLQLYGLDKTKDSFKWKFTPLSSQASKSTGVEESLPGFIEDQKPKQPEEKTGIILYPNPVTDNFTLVIPLEVTHETVEVQVFDNNSRIMHSEKLHLVKGTNMVEVDTKGYLQGIYIVKIKTGTKVISKVILKK